MKQHRRLRLMEGSGISFGLDLAYITLNSVVWGLSVKFILGLSFPVHGYVRRLGRVGLFQQM